MSEPADAPMRGAGPQYHQKVNNKLGLYPIGNSLSKRKQLSELGSYYV